MASYEARISKFSKLEPISTGTTETFGTIMWHNQTQYQVHIVLSKDDVAIDVILVSGTMVTFGTLRTNESKTIKSVFNENYH